MNVGRFRHQVDVAGEFGRLAREDEAAAGLLAHSGAYRQAVYFLVQAMEKQVRAKIFSLVNPKLPYFRERNRTHSLEDAVAFLIEIVSHSETVRRQVKDQLHAHVLGEVRYHHLHNNVRYPVYFEKYDAYSVLEVGEGDYVSLRERLSSLKQFLKDLHRFG